MDNEAVGPHSIM